MATVADEDYNLYLESRDADEPDLPPEKQFTLEFLSEQCNYHCIICSDEQGKECFNAFRSPPYSCLEELSDHLEAKHAEVGFCL